MFVRRRRAISCVRVFVASEGWPDQDEMGLRLFGASHNRDGVRRCARDRGQGDRPIECGETAAHVLREAQKIHVSQLPMTTDDGQVEQSLVSKRDRVRPEDVVSALTERPQPFDNFG